MNIRVPVRKGYAVCIGVYYLVLTKSSLCDLRYRTYKKITQISSDLKQFSNDNSKMKVLNVAEKNDVAKNVARFLSDGKHSTVSTQLKYIHIL